MNKINLIFNKLKIIFSHINSKFECSGFILASYLILYTVAYREERGFMGITPLVPNKIYCCQILNNLAEKIRQISLKKFFIIHF